MSNSVESSDAPVADPIKNKFEFRHSKQRKKQMFRNSFALMRVGLLFSLFSIFCIGVFGQSQANTGNIDGRVTDPNGAALPNVTVTATNESTGLSKSAQTSDEGLYRIAFLPPGVYKVATSGAQGFAAASLTNVTVTVGGQTPLDIQLAVGATTTMVDIAAEGQVVETTRTSVSSV